MGNLVFQATLGGQVNLVGPNTASTYNINVPAVAGNLVTTGDTATVTNTMLAGSIANSKLANSSVTIGSTSISLGSTSTTLAGLTSVAATTIGAASGSNLSLQSNGTTNATLDTNGNLGLGVTPSAWGGSYKAFELPGGVALTSYSTTGDMQLFANAYSDGGAYRYKTSTYASNYEQYQGKHIWYNTTSGTAGNVITFTQAMTLDASGRLGIGATSPATVLNVAASSAGSFASNPIITIYDTNASASARNFGIGCGSAGQLGFFGSTTQGGTPGTTALMTLNASGQLGIGTTSPSSILHLSDNPPIIKLNNNASNDTPYIQGGTSGAGGDGYLYLSGGAGRGVKLAYNNGTVAATVDGSGNLLVGGTTASISSGTGIKLLNDTANHISSVSSYTTSGQGESFVAYSTGASAFRFYVDWAGTIHATSIVITAISDERLKENIRDLDTGLSTVMALKPRRYDWKEGKGLDKKNAAGFIAQEFETVFPDSVGTSKAGADGIEYKNINYEELIPTLVKAIQEQQSIITDLQAKLKSAGVAGF